MEDTLSMALMYQQHLKKAGIRSEVCQSGNLALIELRKGHVSTVLLDLQLPDMNGLDIIQEMDGTSHNITFIVITANGSVNTAVDAMRAGAYDFLIKPFPTEKLLTTVKNALNKTNDFKTVKVLKKGLSSVAVPGFVGDSAPMQSVYKMIENIADSNAAVFITGESGTGKEVTAQSIHKVSQRHDAPFIALNCAALPENLIESEIFGHVKGAFTGAHDARKGAASQAHGVYRLDVLSIELPPLSQRGHDIILLAESFLKTYSEDEGKQFKSIAQDAKDAMLNYHWPGNIRELQNMIRKAAVVHDGIELEAHMISMKSALPAAESSDYSLIGLVKTDAAMLTPNESLKTTFTLDIHQPMVVMERDIIEAVIASCNGSVPKASRILQLSPSTIYRKREAWTQIDDDISAAS